MILNTHPKMTRREFVAAAGGTMVSIGLPGIFVKLLDSQNRALAAEFRADGRPRIPPGQHAVRAIVPMGGIEGPGDIAGWKLQVSGEVDNPLSLNFKDLMKLTQINLTCDVHCVTGWTLLDSKWRGVRVAAIMDLAKVKNSARFVIFEAHADYTTNIPISEAGKQNVILAHQFFGNKLPRAHGAPVRALVPDRYFYKSAKWLKGIRFSAVDEPGYYESGGWSNTADPWKEERFE
ncbi:MAG: molybdopterin-dependent oxidoreductase [Desulfobacterales bacterium]|jgi:DMSO/TMAO reductase YedYZ molybdopterin-dependent catalytic subunit